MTAAPNPQSADTGPNPDTLKPQVQSKASSAPPLARDTPESLAQDAESLCAALEKFQRRGLGSMPSSADTAEIRTQQAMVRDLLRRAAESGAVASKEVTALTAERDQFKDAASRARADFLNYQSRTSKDLSRAEELALRGYMNELLPILDSLDLSIKDAQSPHANLETVQEALNLIATSLNQMLKVRGLVRMETTRNPFDPTQHEPVFQRPADSTQDEQPNMVIEEFRPGYLWKNLVLRAAQVAITQAVPAPHRHGNTE